MDLLIHNIGLLCILASAFMHNNGSATPVVLLLRTCSLLETHMEEAAQHVGFGTSLLMVIQPMKTGMVY